MLWGGGRQFEIRFRKYQIDALIRDIDELEKESLRMFKLAELASKRGALDAAKSFRRTDEALRERIKRKNDELKEAREAYKNLNQ